jgi:hypothetical protein
MQLVESKSFTNGVVSLRYAPAGDACRRKA